jgi:N-acetylglucosaminyldiphosphoundecaprenol N-acetyl-beta-D-mannosaminyltransferase
VPLQLFHLLAAPTMTRILEYDIFNGSFEELMSNLVQAQHKIHIISGNPEILYNGINDEVLLGNFTSKNSLIIPDGAGVVIASRFLKNPVKQKIPGIELMASLLEHCEKNNKPIYLLGAQEEILQRCQKNIKSKYPDILICGCHNGYFNLDDCNNILDDINASKPFALFIAMGSPRQELFITKYMNNLACTLFMGVGGSFDVIAGKVNRAPEWMINYNLEWLYRVSKEPCRIKRLFCIPKFFFKAITYK